MRNRISYLIVLISCTFFSSTEVFSQKKTLEVERIQNNSRLFKSEGFHSQNNEVYQELVKRAGRELFLGNGTKVSLRSDEGYLFHGEDYYVISKQVSRYERLISRIESDSKRYDLKAGYETTVTQLDPEGRFLVDDFAHGAGEGFTFYDSKLRKFLSYNSFGEMMKLHVAKNRVYIYTRPDFYEGDSATIASIDIDNSVINTNKIYVGQSMAIDLKSDGDYVCLLLSDFRERKSDMIVLSPSMDLMNSLAFAGNKNIGKINLDQSSHAIIARSIHQVSSIDLITGETNWLKSHSYKTDTHRIVSFFTTNSGLYVELEQKAGKTTSLYAYDTRTGLLQQKIDIPDFASKNIKVLQGYGANKILILSESNEAISVNLTPEK